MSWQESGREFFGRMAEHPAVRYLKWDSQFVLRAGNGSLSVRASGGKIVEVMDQAAPIGPHDLELEADADTWRAIFAGSVSPGTAFYRAQLFIPEIQSKRNLAVAICRAMRATQQGA